MSPWEAALYTSSMVSEPDTKGNVAPGLAYNKGIRSIHFQAASLPAIAWSAFMLDHKMTEFSCAAVLAAENLTINDDA